MMEHEQRPSSVPAVGSKRSRSRERTPPVRPSPNTNAAHQPHPAYSRGQYDHLLAPKPPAPAAPGELHAVLIGISASGISIIATEQRSDGRAIKHLVNEFPYYVDITLPDGRSVQVEARMFEPQPPDPEEVEVRKRKRNGSSSSKRPVLVAGSLYAFSSDSSAYTDCGADSAECSD